jgi:hypothetical protein
MVCCDFNFQIKNITPVFWDFMLQCVSSLMSLKVLILVLTTIIKRHYDF